jgi:hypothetical protein
MSESPKAKRRESRQERLRAALRENLRRRKAQARGRGAAEGDAAEPGESGETVDPKRKP